MKTIITLCLFLFTGIGALQAQCNPFFDLEEGTSWEMTNYDKKDNVQGRQVTTVKTLNETSAGWEAILHLVMFDKKDKEQFDQELEVACSEGIIKMDMSRFIPAEMMNPDMKMEVTSENIQWPADLEVGQTLPDASVLIDMGMMKITTNITDRKVEGKETITTPAGTFECYKVTYTTKMKLMGEREFSGVDYISEKVGVVKTLSYDKKGNLSGYTQLTKFNAG
jgi:hypothetical protein